MIPPNKAMPRFSGSPARVVGGRAGTLFAWLSDKRLRLALVGEDGTLGAPSAWGRNALQLCDGVATGDHRFGVGWLERDGGVWFVHGPIGAAVNATAVPAAGADGNAATNVAGASGNGRNESVASVMTPSVPSLPTNNRVRS